MDEELKSVLDELKTKMAGLEKIAEMDTAVIEDSREMAKTAKELKSANERMEDSIAHLPSKWREDIKQHMATLSNPEVEKGSPAEEWQDMSKMDREMFVKTGDPESANRAIGQPEGTVFRKSFLSPVERRELREKAITATSGVGAGTTPAMLWNEAIVGDPWAGAGAFQMAPSAPNFQTLEVNNVQFAASTTTTAASFDSPVGTLGSASTHSVLTYACRILIPQEQEFDVMGTVSHIEQMVRLAYGKLRGSLTTAKVASGSKAGNDVATGTANTALTSSNAFAKLLSLTATGSVADYWDVNPCYVLHPKDYNSLLENLSGKSGLNHDPQTGIMRLYQFPIKIDNQAEANATNAKHPDFFGSWAMALVQAQRGRLTLDRYMATVPGAIALYGTFRFLPVVVNNEAYAQIKVGT